MVAPANNGFRGLLVERKVQTGDSSENVLAIGRGSVSACAVSDTTVEHRLPSKASGLSRCRSVYPMSASATLLDVSQQQASTSHLSSALPYLATETESESSSRSFARDVQRYAHSMSPNTVTAFHRPLREAMEFHLAKARLRREKARNRTHLQVHAAIASSVGVPYTGIRSERPFLFDSDTHPLHTALAEAIGVDDLSQLHRLHADASTLLAPLRTKAGRIAFQACYDGFVTSFCVPLLHSLAMSKNLFHSTTDSASDSSSSSITYRYQAFPTIRVRQPGDDATEPTCDTSDGHSIGYLRFHVPLTPVQTTNALYTESHPGREDWHPLVAKSVGLGFLFDGARCLHFDMYHEPSNPAAATVVSLEFRIAIYREGERFSFVGNNNLCSKELLEDAFSRAGPGYYDEAVIGIGLPTWQIVAKKYGDHLLDPDHRVGAPF